MKLLILFSFWLLVLPLFAQAAVQPVHHQLRVVLEPEKQSLRVTDRLTLPDTVDSLVLSLHPGLNPRFSSTHSGLKMVRLHADRYRETYRVSFDKPANQLSLEYAGKIYDALSSSKAEKARGFRRSAGLIDADGVFLTASSGWYPQVHRYPFVTFDIQVETPDGWSSVSQGRQEQDHHWAIDKPQEDIYLIAARFQGYQRPVDLQQGAVSAQVFLRSEDQALADRYLKATASYLKMYEELLGPYPYSKFALVENFWETGFGMPSFTLLGSRVIRFPFILHSSYPHEILHNWWGNGVYVDFETGNWSEGLTAYLADHLIKEQRGKGVEYRLQSLQKYRDYAAKSSDFALTEFTSRHSPATAAVGYGKTLMLFHMLRKQFGDEVFTKALRKLYQDYKFRVASFDDVRGVFEQVTGTSLKSYFIQWVERIGAPAIALKDVRTKKTENNFQLSFSLEQSQSGDPYVLQAPVAVSLLGQAEAKTYVVTLSQREQRFNLELPAAVTRLDIDPEFDLFRKLALTETPPAFTQVFGAEELLLVLSSNEPEDMQKAWQKFAEDVTHMGPKKVSVVLDTAIDALPNNQAVMVLGWNNRFTKAVKALLEKHPADFGGSVVGLAEGSAQLHGNTFAFVTREKGASDKRYPVALVVSDLPAALPGLGRKIPHYHKYSYLAFSGERPQIKIKGRWPVNNSPMTHYFEIGAARAVLPKVSPLIAPFNAKASH